MDADVTFEYILPACARIAKAIKHDFLQYLPLIYPPLLAGANQEIQFSFEDADDDEKVGEVRKTMNVIFTGELKFEFLTDVS
jgi:hypothetical protein